MIEHHSGNIVNDDNLVNLEIKKSFTKEDVLTLPRYKLVTFRASSRNPALVVAFIKRCNRTRYGGC